MALLLSRVAPSFRFCGMEGASVMDATRNHLLTDMSIDVILIYMYCIKWWVHTFIYWCASVSYCCISGISVAAWSHTPEINAPLICQECSRSIPARCPSNVQVRCPSMMSRMIQEYKREWILNMLHNSQEYKRTIRNTKKYQWDTKNI